jgi:hypothetical protein
MGENVAAIMTFKGGEDGTIGKNEIGSLDWTKMRMKI